MSDSPLIDTALGDLTALEGTWEGEGFNMLAVPDPAEKEKYRIIAQTFKETLTFARITDLAANDSVPNRKLDQTQFISALEYTQQVVDKDDQAIHYENGLWLMLNDDMSPNRIARQSSVPHGNSLLAPGVVFTVPGGAKIDPVCVLPQHFQPQIKALMDNSTQPLEQACAEFLRQHGNGELQPYAQADQQFKAANIDYFLNPNKSLVDHNAALKAHGSTITNTIVYELDTKHPGGGVLNIPFFKPASKQVLGDHQQLRNVIECPALTSTFWLNSIRDSNGQQFQELQYTQQTAIEFFNLPNGEQGLIMWPHIDVATLSKVK